MSSLVDSQPEKPSPTVADKDDTNTTLEIDYKQFQKWKEGSEVKYISKDLVKDANRSIQMSELADSIVWNIFNFRSHRDAVFPEKKPTEGMITKAFNWIKIFKKYVMEVMKEMAKDDYIQTFNTAKFACLCKSNVAVVDWGELKNILRDETSKEVRDIVMFDWMIYCFLI